MTDKSWLLNPKAIAAAKQCILIVNEELGVKLKLSHPDFIDLLYEYCELTDSTALLSAFKNLINMAGKTVQQELIQSHKKNEEENNKVVTPFKAKNETDTFSLMPESQSNNFVNDEKINYQGKQYPRWQADKEFKGLYRGQPRYA